jgi:hypothetical protein
VGIQSLESYHWTTSQQATLNLQTGRAVVKCRARVQTRGLAKAFSTSGEAVSTRRGLLPRDGGGGTMRGRPPPPPRAVRRKCPSPQKRCHARGGVSGGKL